MKLSEEEITKHLLNSSQTLGEVKGLITQVIEHHSSFTRDRKAEYEKLTKSIDDSRVETREEIKQFVKGMNKKIDDNVEACELRDKASCKKIEHIEFKVDELSKAIERKTFFAKGVAWVFVGIAIILSWIGFDDVSNSIKEWVSK